MKRTTNGFERLSIPEFSLLTDHIVDSMTGNALFTDVQTKVLEIKTDDTAFATLVQLAVGRDQTACLNRDAARAVLTDKLHRLGLSVDNIAQGDEGILSASGFPYTQDRKTSPNIVQPDTPKVSAGVNKGEIECRTYSQPGMKSVNFYISTDPAAANDGPDVAWTIISWNKVKYTFSGLASGVRCYMKVGLVGVRGQEAISDVVSYIPQ